MMQRLNERAFTIVELLIVIVVIVILAAITIVSYVGVQESARFSRAMSDMKHINDAIIVYKAQNGSYPAGNDTFQLASEALASETLPSLVPDYLDSADILTAETGFNYRYRADTTGTNYKLLRIAQGGAALPSQEVTGNELLTTGTVYPNNAWGYWSPGAATW